MSKVTNVFHVAGNYIAEQHIDIHDNQNVIVGNEREQSSLNDTAKPSDDANDTRSAEDILGIPHEGKYSEVRRYIEERKRFDEEFKTFCNDRTLRDLCNRLTKEFGWFVDENSLQRNLNRDLKKKQ